jgi:hypothetical protein
LSKNHILNFLKDINIKKRDLVHFYFSHNRLKPKKLSKI